MKYSTTTRHVNSSQHTKKWFGLEKEPPTRLEHIWWSLVFASFFSVVFRNRRSLRKFFLLSSKFISKYYCDVKRNRTHKNTAHRKILMRKFVNRLSFNMTWTNTVDERKLYFFFRVIRVNMILSFRSNAFILFSSFT